MPSAKSPRSTPSHSVDQKLLRTKEVVIHRSSRRSNSCQCCAKRLVALPLLGFTIFSIGCLLGIGYFSIHRVTSSAYHTEGLIPSYITGAVVSSFVSLYDRHIKFTLKLGRVGKTRFGKYFTLSIDSKGRHAVLFRIKFIRPWFKVIWKLTLSWFVTSFVLTVRWLDSQVTNQHLMLPEYSFSKIIDKTALNYIWN